MSRILKPTLFLIFACLTVAASPATASAAPPPAVTEKVNCTKNGSINKALAKTASAAAVIIEITGMCNENVVVARDRVTLKGTDPATDGIQATGNTEQSDAALWVRGGQFVVVENLKLTGGFTGLLATDVSVPVMRLNNCRLEGNAFFGAQLQNALVQAQDSTFGPNSRTNVNVSSASRFICLNCTLTNAAAPPIGGPDNVSVFGGSQALFFNSTLVNGGVNASNSQVSLTDSSVQWFDDPNGPGFGRAIVGSASSSFTLVRTQVEGGMTFAQGTTGTLLGVTQTSGVAPFTVVNNVDDSSMVRVSTAFGNPGPPATPTVTSSVLGFAMRNFGNSSIHDTTQVNGNMFCDQGGNAYCSPTKTVNGTSSCGLCPVP
jgi:hypothetical protein